MRVIDCFSYFNEKELLELRINLLYDSVDKFIITDANKTHKGDPKPFTCKDTLKELGLLKDKVQVIEVDLPSYEEEPDPWVREGAQRDAASQYFEDDDVCIVSDCDEIMDPKFVRYYASFAPNFPNNILRIPLVFLMRRADLRVYDDKEEAVCFNVPFICLKTHLEKYTLSEIRESHALNNHNLDFPDIFLSDNGKIEYAGWHFSWMGDDSRIKTKANSFLHWNQIETIKNSVFEDPLGRKDHILKPYPLNLLPQKIFELENVKKFLFQSDTVVAEEKSMEIPDVIGEIAKKTSKNNELSTLLSNYINNPEDSENNFSLAIYYDNIGQTASALSYYLRAAERTEDELIRYECLIRGSMCFDKQGTRGFTVKGMLQHAISIQPKRPEAYYLLSRFYERDEKDGHWIDSYMIASIGEKVCDFECSTLRTDVDYPGVYGILYQKAVSSWWCGLCDESRDLFQKLYNEYELDEHYKKSVVDNLVRLNGFKQEERFPIYTNEKYPLLKFKFPGAESIERNFSESYQDMFVLTMLNGKRNGTYLEIGAGNSFYGNNTALLEKTFDWTGVAVDLCEEFVNAHNNERKNPCLLKNALSINYESLLSGMDFSETVDYLQLDCDPPEVTYKILLNIPFEKYKFAVITYEHDYYCDETKSFQEKSRKYLESYGYIRVVNNISPDEFRPYEDWWVHPDLIDKNILNEMMFIDDTTKKAENYILEKS